MIDMGEKLKKLFADVLKVPVTSISEQSSFNEIPSWDSLNHLSLIATTEETFGIDIEPEEIPLMMENFGKFKAVVLSKLS
jgi:acyl carrier protein